KTKNSPRHIPKALSILNQYQQTSAYTLSKKRLRSKQKFTVLVEFSAVLAENSTSTADIPTMPMRFSSSHIQASTRLSSIP
ncbi:MAG: hypothetical protein II338_05935, partial [Bacteroidaceae bacterium]|nr:hypothetical protein [Bacteroidaceae bacterium]